MTCGLFFWRGGGKGEMSPRKTKSVSAFLKCCNNKAFRIFFFFLSSQTNPLLSHISLSLSLVFFRTNSNSQKNYGKKNWAFFCDKRRPGAFFQIPFPAINVPQEARIMPFVHSAAAAAADYSQICCSFCHCKKKKSPSSPTFRSFWHPEPLTEGRVPFKSATNQPKLRLTCSSKDTDRGRKKCMICSNFVETKRGKPQLQFWFAGGEKDRREDT